MISETSTLADLGWSTHFSTQRDIDELQTTVPARVMAVHRNRLVVQGDGFEADIIPPRDGVMPTVGDWLLLTDDRSRLVRLLDRRSVFKRKAPGIEVRTQLIAANVDALFIVSSCNQDFNVARLERYLALARQAEVTPLVILTKADLADDPGVYRAAAEKLLPGLLVETLDAREAIEAGRLAAWCGRGQTVALVGSSGVGKSTMVNALTGDATAATQAVRTDDDKGRHTTTGRQLHRLPSGGWLVDTPGMRELQLTDVEAGLADVFADLDAIAARCRFADCRHNGEPGCAVAQAMAIGEIDAARVKRWRKLVAEEAFNNATLAERRARDRAFGKMARQVMADKRSRRGD